MRTGVILGCLEWFPLFQAYQTNLAGFCMQQQ